MVKVTIKKGYLETEFEFKDFDLASEFANLALMAATVKITVEFEKVDEPEEPQGEPEPVEVQQDEPANVEAYF